MTSLKSIAVVGAGIAGISAARMLSDHGYDVQTFEREDSIGGLVRCSIEKGNLYHRVGGHVFNSKNLQVLEWFWKHFDRDREFVKAKRNASVFLNGAHVPYPIELSLRHLDHDMATRIIHELVEMSAKPLPQDDGNELSFGHFLLSNFGETLANLYFFPYNQKIWKQDLFQMSLDWLEGKLPMSSPIGILESNILSSSDSMVHSEFYYPVNGGSQFIVDRLGSGLPVSHKTVTSIERLDTTLLINNQSEFSDIVYTGDIRLLPGMLSESAVSAAGITADEASAIRELKANGTTTLLCECDDNPYSWIYLPDDSTKLHRMIMTGNFSSTNSDRNIPAGRTTCTVEYSGRLSEAEMIRELSSLPLRPTPIAYHHCPGSYVIHDHGTASVVDIFLNKLESIRIYCCGRFAQWQYFNMDAAIASAMQVTSKIASQYA